MGLAHLKELQQRSSPLWYVRLPWVVCSVQLATRKRALTEIRSCCHPGLGLSDNQNYEKCISVVYKPPSLIPYSGLNWTPGMISFHVWRIPNYLHILNKLPLSHLSLHSLCSTFPQYKEGNQNDHAFMAKVHILVTCIMLYI